MLIRLSLATVVLSMMAPGCASQQNKFHTLEKRDKLRFAACRHDVVRRLCPDDPDCDVKASMMYANEPPRARRQWLFDYGCPGEKIQHADEAVRRKERESIGMDPNPQAPDER